MLFNLFICNILHRTWFSQLFCVSLNYWQVQVPSAVREYIDMGNPYGRQVLFTSMRRGNGSEKFQQEKFMMTEKAFSVE